MSDPSIGYAPIVPDVDAGHEISQYEYKSAMVTGPTGKNCRGPNHG